jgi:plasmid maintenance system killer protein
MMRTFGDASTKRFALGGPSKYCGMDERLARRRLAQLHAASALADLGQLNSVGLHKLAKRQFKEFLVDRRKWPSANLIPVPQGRCL